MTTGRVINNLGMKRLSLLVTTILAVLCWESAGRGQSVEEVKGMVGQGPIGLLNVSKHWELPNTPNGLKPTQSWHATGSSPEGDIFVAGMDHVTNSALYRLDPSNDTLRYLGDARSASEAANNWQPGETAQKFHTRPLWHEGKIYVATMDRSRLNEEHLSIRGFHWYLYDPIQDNFIDLSATEPDGIAGKQASIVTITSDPQLNVLYGFGVPTGEIYKYDVSLGKTENLGRPDVFDRKYLYSGRVMWVDSLSRLYFSAGRDYSSSIYDHIYYYDPASGFGEMKNWKLQGNRAIELGQCLPDRKQCFFTDDQGRVYRFDDEGPSWSYIGKVQTAPAKFWVFHVSADGKKAYFVTSSLGPNTPFNPNNPNLLYELDLVTKTTRKLCNLADLDPQLAQFNRHTGYDAWDGDGRFYFSSFASKGNDRAWGRNVIVSAIDPVRLKVALGLLPSLTEVEVVKFSQKPFEQRFILSHNGSTSTSYEILYQVSITDSEGKTQQKSGNTIIPAGNSYVIIDLQQLRVDARQIQGQGKLTIIPNGNNYIVGSNSRGGVEIHIK